MILGHTIHSDTDTTGVTYYSPWFPRQGNLILAACQVVAVNDDVSEFKIQVQTKTAEDSDKAAVNVGTAVTITTTAGTITKIERGADVGDTTNQGMQDLVRFAYTLIPTTGNDCWVHFRMLSSGWLSS